MKLEMEGREPFIVLFGLPIVTAAVVLGSMYLGRMQAELNSTQPVYVEPKVTVTPRITAEIPQGVIRNEISVPPAQIHEVVREAARTPDVNIVNKVEPTPVQVMLPKTPGREPQVIVIPVPLPLQANSDWAAALQAPTTPPVEIRAEKPIEVTKVTPPTPHSTETEVEPKTAIEPVTAAVTPVVPPPPEHVKPTPVSTDSRPDLVEPDVEGKLLPPPRNTGDPPVSN